MDATNNATGSKTMKQPSRVKNATWTAKRAEVYNGFSDAARRLFNDLAFSVAKVDGQYMGQCSSDPARHELEDLGLVTIHYRGSKPLCLTTNKGKAMINAYNKHTGGQMGNKAVSK